MEFNKTIKTPDKSSIISIIGEKSLFSRIEKEHLITRFENINTILQELKNKTNVESINNTLVPGIYLKKKEVFITVNNTDTIPYTGIKTDQTIFIHSGKNKTEIISQRNGYLIVKNGEFSIFDPYQLSDDKVHLHYIFYPIVYGHREILADFFHKASLPSKDSSLRSFTELEIDKIIESGSVNIVTLSIGTEPGYGEKGVLVLKKQISNEPHMEQDGSMDYHSFSSFLEVEEGSVLATKTESRPSHPGIDAFGAEIPVPVIKELEFKAGNNVLEEQDEEGLIIYTAAVKGILELTDNSVSISEELHIKGNICARTGNISFSKSVIIEGNVEYQFKVECGGSLTIKGSVENGSIINCKGSLFVEKGIIGDKTRFFVKGDVETGFLQDTKIRVLGNLTVHSYIYNSRVFCGGVLTVEGKKLKNKKRGAVLGSIVTSMKQMYIHSAGSDFSKTTLSCGLDPELEQQLVEMKKAVPQLNTKLLQLQNRIGLDLTHRDIGSKLKALPQTQKKKVKKLLEEIKFTAKQKDAIESRILNLKDQAVNPNISELSIHISSHIIPDTQIILGGIKGKIEKPGKAVSINIEHGNMVFQPLTK